MDGTVVVFRKWRTLGTHGSTQQMVHFGTTVSTRLNWASATYRWVEYRARRCALESDTRSL